MKKTTVIASLIAAALLPAAMRADTLTVGGAVTGYTLAIKDTAVGSVTAAIDPYSGTLNSGLSSQQSVLLFCIDPDHWDTASTYNIVSSVNGFGNGTNQNLNGLSTLAKATGFTSASQLYGGLAWLSQQLYAQEQGPQTAAAILTQEEDQAAIWALADYTNTFQVTTSPSSSLSLAQFDSAVSTLEGQAFNQRLSSGFTILTQQGETANCSSCAQEYLVLTPEPGSLGLMAGAIPVALWLRRRKLFGRD